MEMTIEQALQRAVEAHKAGKLQDAEALYRAILQIQPQHPDANHNLGVMAVSLNKSKLALPLFKIALEANPKQGQFWLSYVDALIKEKQFDNARKVLEQGKKRGLAGQKVDVLEEEISSIFPTLNSEALSANKNLPRKLIKGNYTRSPSQIDINNLLKYHQKGQHALALNLAKVLTQEYPNHPFGWKVLGLLFIQIGKLQDSLVINQKVVEISPNDPEAHYNLGITLKGLGRLEDAETSYKKAIAIKPAYAEAFSNLGNILQELGRLEDAETSYKKAITIKPDLAEAYSNLGNILQELGRLEDAVVSYSKAIAIKPAYAEAHYNLGITLKGLGRLEEAETSYNKAIAIKPDYAEAYSNLGNILQELGRLEDAETSCKKAIAIKPAYTEAHYNLGITLQELGRLEDAETSYKNAIAIKPAYAEAHYNLGNTLHELGKLEDAETSYKKAITFKPDLAEAYSNWGNILHELGRLEDAETSYKKAIEIKPAYAEAHYNLGITLKGLGRLEDAETSYNKAIAIKPDYAEAYSNLGNILHELGRLEDAETNCKKAIVIKPEYAEAYSNLGNILQELGRLEDAGTSLHRSLEIKSIPVSREKASPVIALLPFGRSGSLFLHSLFDGHPDIATLPGVYFKGWFGMNSWQQLAPDLSRSDWRERLVAMVIKKHQPLFDANNKQNVPGKPFGEAGWLSKDLGFMEMGEDRSWPFVVDQNAFAATFLNLLKMHESIDIKGCFELIHRAFEIAIRCNEGDGSKPNGHIFYHIHNPNPFERAHFLQHYPQAILLHLMRNPVQSLESWLLQLDLGNRYSHVDCEDSKFENSGQLKNWSQVVNRVVTMAINMRLPDNRLPGRRGVRLEDVKQNPRKTMSNLAAWMGISDHAVLYESSFCGLQYWGPSSKATGKITGFDTKAIDQPLGRLFGPKDVVIFETLFWPLARLYRYSDLNAEDFQRQLKEIRPWLDEPLGFETLLYANLPDHTRRLKDLPQYRRLHSLLHLLWSVLDRDGTYQNMVQPLELDK
jgi:tetratricopeptide (TPR) repeat protein